MNLHEWQSKKILKKAGIPVPDFGVASSFEEAARVVKDLNLSEGVVKIQVHAGGRGKAGGVQFGKTPDEIIKKAKELLGMKLVNEQTGPEGVIAKTVLISRSVAIAKEYYLSVLIDRKKCAPILLASAEGGMEIEKYPDKVAQISFGFDGKIRPYQLLRLVKIMGWSGEIAKQGIAIAERLARCFLEVDASLFEINPLVETPQGELLAIDAKCSIDDNALFRQKELSSYFDASQISPQEAMAKEQDLAYVAMNGTIGCMVNGAGLAMGTMDMIQLSHGSPANFLDVGGSATKEKIAFGFQVILSDPKVRAIFVNIFGGIMNCATLAEGVIYAARSQKISVPIIVRMEGTNVEEGKRLFQESGLKISLAFDLASGARLSVEGAKK